MEQQPLQLFLLLPELNQLLRNGLPNPQKSTTSLHPHLESSKPISSSRNHLVKLLFRPLHPIVKEKGLSETPVLPPAQDI